jgi:hypothetical protein
LNKTSTPAMLASLSVAAGALASTAAEASIVVQHVGQTGGVGAASPLLVPLPGIGASLSFASRGSSINGNFALTTSVFGKNANFLFEVESSNSLRFAKPMTKGTFDTAGGTNSAVMEIRSSQGATFGPNPSGVQYFNFLFSTNSQTYAGWFSGSYNNNSIFNDNFIVQSVAYDTTPGNLLGAGDGPSPVPEPPSAALLALAAMATGAAATRRYKRARRDG